MSDRRESNFHAVGGEECMLVGEECIYGELHILLELNSLSAKSVLAGEKLIATYSISM
jgi:hypothetical protein